MYNVFSKLDRLIEEGLIKDYSLDIESDVNCYGKEIQREELTITFHNGVKISIASKELLIDFSKE